MEQLNRQKAGKIMGDAKDCVKRGGYLLAIGQFNGIIKGLNMKDEFASKLLISEAMRMLGTTIGLWNLSLQERKDFQQEEIEEMWKPVFSYLRAAIAYQRAIGDKLGLASSWSQILIFRLGTGEILPKVLPEMKHLVDYIITEEIKFPDGKTLKGLGKLKQFFLSISSVGFSIEEVKKHTTEVIMDL